MVGIQGVGGIPEPKPERPVPVRNKDTSSAEGAKSQDDVLISSEAQAAANLAKIVQRTVSDNSDVRAERVSAAREAIERGDYKNPEVVAQVAQRVSKYL